MGLLRGEHKQAGYLLFNGLHNFRKKLQQFVHLADAAAGVHQQLIEVRILRGVADPAHTEFQKGRDIFRGLLQILPELPPDPVPDGPLQLFHAGKVGKDGGHGHMHGFGYFPGRNRIQAPFFRHQIGGFLDLFPCESYFWRHGTFFLPVFDTFDFIITVS